MMLSSSFRSEALLCAFALLCQTSVFAFAPATIRSSFASTATQSNAKINNYAGRRRTSCLFMAAINKDFYKLLEVERDADADDIKYQYRQMARKYHPDANPGKDTTEQFQEINRAYEVLKDPDLKKKYDMYGERGIGTSAASDAQAGSPFGGPGGGFGQEVDLGDIFDSFFGGGGGGGFGSPGGARQGGQRTRQRGPVSGDDLRFDLDIDFDTAVFGGETKVRIRHAEKCGGCTNGDGVKPGSKVVTCSECNGVGVTVQVVRTPLGNMQTQAACASCRGDGQRVEEYCGTCSGKGLETKTKQIKVTIPAGVQDGNKLRVRGEGDAGPKGGPAGDLYIFLKVKKSKTFTREGMEIFSEQKISYTDAILGASIKTKVVDGEVTIKVPPGTQPGQVMRIKNNGAPVLNNPTKRGDHFVTVKIDIPSKLSKEEMDLMLKLKEIQDERQKKEGKGFFEKFQ